MEVQTRERERERERERWFGLTYLVAGEYFTSFRKTPNLIEFSVTTQPHYNINIGFIIYLNFSLLTGSCNIFCTKERKLLKNKAERKRQ
jgi:hypothetical protein